MILYSNLKTDSVLDNSRGSQIERIGCLLSPLRKFQTVTFSATGNQDVLEPRHCAARWDNVRAVLFLRIILV